MGRPVGVDSDYVFMGWYLDPGYQTEVDWSSTMPARNLQVYAKWAKPDYTVSFNTHGADTETPAPIGVAKDRRPALEPHGHDGVWRNGNGRAAGNHPL